MVGCRFARVVAVVVMLPLSTAAVARHALPTTPRWGLGLAPVRAVITTFNAPRTQHIRTLERRGHHVMSSPTQLVKACRSSLRRSSPHRIVHHPRSIQAGSRSAIKKSPYRNVRPAVEGHATGAAKCFRAGVRHRRRHHRHRVG